VTYPDDNVLAFEKTDYVNDFLVLVNVRNSKQTFKNIPRQWQNTTLTDMMTGRTIKLGKDAELTPFQYMILKK
jgi:hypothetical protein